MALLELSNLAIEFQTRRGILRAVNDVSYTLDKGETLGIVGESGSGKSVSCLSLLGLLPKDTSRIANGSAVLDGVGDLLQLSEDALRKVRGRRISMIFQDPMTALNPYLRISTQLIEPLRLHFGMGVKEARERAIKELEAVGIPVAAERVDNYPHQFSGGMRQRVMIAMALLTQPDILIADEPTTALDVTVQAQIMELLKKRQAELGTAILLVTHDLGIVAGFCDRVVVMYAGKVLESGNVGDIFKNPAHPYSWALRRTLPSEGASGELETIPGAPPSPDDAPTEGCPFAPRCRFALQKCVERAIHNIEVLPNHHSACIRYQDGELREELQS